MVQKEKYSIDSHVKFVKGVGPKKGSVLNRAGIHTIRDLLYHAPRRYLDRTEVMPIGKLAPNMDATVLGTVESYGSKYISRGRRQYLVYVSDGTGTLELIWFRNVQFLEGLFSEGDALYISGKTTKLTYPQMAHPEFEFVSDRDEPLHTLGLIPIYPTTAELKDNYLDSRGFRRIIRAALDRYESAIEEDLPAGILEKPGGMPLAEALRNIHFPESEEKLRQSRRRLAFSELFYMELLLAIRKYRSLRLERGIKFNKPGSLVKDLGGSLPFELTASQRKVLKEIYSDMTSNKTMRRLLQGDVGSGKTIVAALSCALAIENGYKAVIMVPTEILAEQHYINLSRLFEKVGVDVLLLTGGVKEKAPIYEKLKLDRPCLAVGTHALIQEKVDIRRLGLAVIDEQHRFGVRQRVELISGSESADLLVMTATPIPRTLAMTLYGDFDYSVIDELPPGRQPVETVVLPEEDQRRVMDEIKLHLENGNQVYIVYPLVEISEKQDLQAAVDAYERLSRGSIAEYGVGLLHGRLTTNEKAEVLGLFNAGKIKVLVTTTVIEVGIDSPQATLIVIVGAERFGVSQLHQLRGRVGRGSKKSVCILKLTGNLSVEGKQRMKAMESTNDGFRIAEYDLQIRGPGEFFGTRQHGFPEFRFADISGDVELIGSARKAAFELIGNDPHLRSTENLPVRIHLARYYADLISR